MIENKIRLRCFSVNQKSGLNAYYKVTLILSDLIMLAEQKNGQANSNQVKNIKVVEVNIDKFKLLFKGKKLKTIVPAILQSN